MYEKLSKYKNYYDICRKINKFPEFYMIIDRKIPEFYTHNNCPKKIFSRTLRGGGQRAHPFPRLLSLWADLRFGSTGTLAGPIARYLGQRMAV